MSKKSTGKKRRKRFRFLKRFILYVFIIQLLYIIALKWINPPFTLTTLGSRIALIGTDRSFHREWASYGDIALYAKLAVIAGEDQRFPSHHGFDMKSIRKAWEHNHEGGRRRGASTISQQTAKNVFLWQGGGWFRKGLEVYFTFMIEHIWGKKRILEVYLNVAQMGKGIFGVEAASEYYFHVQAKKLSRVQAAMLAASLPNPLYYTIKPLAGRTRYRQRWILSQMRNLRGNPELEKLLHEP